MAKCTITGTIITGIEDPVIGTVIYAVPAVNGYSSLVTSTGTYRFISLDPVKTVTTVTGTFSLSLVSGFSYRIVIRVIGLDEVITIPFSSTPINLFSLLGLSSQTTTQTSTGGTSPIW